MSSILRTGATGVLSPISRTSLILAILLSAGCSADVTRFGYGSRDTTSSLPVPRESIRGGGNGPPRGVGLTDTPLPPSDGPGTYRVVGREYSTPPPAYDRPPAYDQAAPQAYDPPPSDGPSPSYSQPPRQAYGPPPAHEPPPHYSLPGRPPAHQPLARGGGETIEVQPGETLYSIARRHGVGVATLKDANGLTSDAVRPGQRLVVPSSSLDRGPMAKGPPPASEPSLDRPGLAKAPGAARGLLPGAQPPPGWDGRYAMKNGDTLNGIALRHGVSVDDLMRANNITDPSRLWGGTVLAVPEQQAAPTQASKGPPRIIQVPPKIISAVPEAPPTRTAKRSDVLSDAAPAPAEFTGKFRWPARGKLVAGFGKRPDGKQNDGINILMPLGTDIVASESGKVAYAGNELKGYGNLVLIRHPNGWVTAYAHADRLLVNYDQEVSRGQVIAKVGKTGSVDEPQLHFELRRDSRPVDPIPHLGN